jgi:hypothetical protein
MNAAENLDGPRGLEARAARPPDALGVRAVLALVDVARPARWSRTDPGI